MYDTELAAWPALASLLLQGHPELVSSYLDEAVLRDVDPLTVKALAAVGHGRGLCRRAAGRGGRHGGRQTAVRPGPTGLPRPWMTW